MAVKVKRTATLKSGVGYNKTVTERATGKKTTTTGRTTPVTKNEFASGSKMLKKAIKRSK